MAALREALCALALLACGEPIADSHYRGEPIFVLRGNATGAADRIDPVTGSVRVGLFWDPTGKGTDPSSFVEQQRTSQTSAVPFSYSLEIFDPPEQSLLAQARGVPIGVGRLFAYLDDDGDGAFGNGEVLVGSTFVQGLLYAPRPYDAATSPTGRALGAGLHHQFAGFKCAAPATPPGDSCGVPLGQSCASDAQCGNRGVCIRRLAVGWPQGSCAIRNDAGCTPGGAVLLSGGAMMGPPIGLWVKGCASDQDCRGFPYRCEVSVGACMPIGVLDVHIANQVSLSATCPLLD